ncbi:MAG: PepSY domain-containing protein [Sideroxydans sp.]|nr:PepSY domain-containing protein [Sideroxydans sp.]
MTKHLYRWHWRIGMVALIAIVVWCFSGVLHPIMSRFQAKAVKLDAVQLITPSTLQTPAEVLAQNSITQVAELNVLNWQGKTWYQVRLPNQAQRDYFNAADGALLPQGDALYAQHLAREYLGDVKSEITESRLLTEFTGEYADVNRLLPVWQIQFKRDDGMRVYIATGSGRMATLVDNLKAFSSTEFSLLHRWDWINTLSPWLRVALASVMLLANIAVVVMGMWIYGLRWNNFSPKWGLRRVHRITGITLSVAALMFAVSGLYHLWNKQVRGDNATRIALAEQLLSVSDLTLAPSSIDTGMNAVRRLSLVQWDGQNYWRFEPSQAKPAKPVMGDPEHQHGKPADKPPATPSVDYTTTDGVLVAMGDAAYAQAILREAIPAAAPNAPLTVINRFSDDYGFLYKRLPVWRAQYDDGKTLYVDTADRKIAAVIQTSDRAERWVFSNIHKLNFLDPVIGKDWRDLVAGVLAASLMMISILGAWLYLRVRMKRTAGKTSVKN